MANAGHIDIVRDRIDHWNEWRRKNTKVVPDFAGADLSELNLAGANLAKADFSGAKLAGTNLGGANLNGADLTGAFLIRADLSGASLLQACMKGANLGQASLFRAKLVGAVLSQASFFKADLSEADLSEANLEGANLQEAIMERTNLRSANAANANFCFATLLRANLENAVLDNCAVYGASLWDVNLSESRQRDLDIMPAQQPVLSVDGLQTAQLVGMLLHHEKARYEVFSITLNTVLVIGRFPPERKPVLMAIKEALRRGDYSPLVLDFHLPGSGDKNEIVKTLGRMSRFVIADLTDDRRIAETLDAVVHFLPSIPIQPIGQKGREQGIVDSHYHKYRWVLPSWRFTDPDDLAEKIGREVIAPAEQKAAEIRQKMNFEV